MSKRSGFTLIELLVVIAIIALLMAILMPALARVRKQAKNVVCQSNISQWGDIFAMYLNDHDGYFWWGCEDSWWSTVLKPYGAGEDYDFWCCPMATKPRNDMQGNMIKSPGAYTAWGFEIDDKRDDYGSYGSYGLNTWVVNPPPWRPTIRAGKESPWCWRSVNVKGADNIPLFLGSKQNSGFPEHTDTPPPGGAGQMQRHCLNRHDGAINGLFLDLSARRIPVTCLWHYKWHRYFDIYAEKPDFEDTWMEKYKQQPCK